MRHYTPSSKGGDLFSTTMDNLKIQGQHHGLSDLNEPYTMSFNDIEYTIYPTAITPRLKWAVSNFGPDMNVQHTDGSSVKPEEINEDILHVFTLLTGRVRWIINGELWELRTRKEALLELVGDVGSVLIFATAVATILSMKTQDSR